MIQRKKDGKRNIQQMINNNDDERGMQYIIHNNGKYKINTKNFDEKKYNKK